MKLKIALFALLLVGVFPSLGFSNTIFFPQVAYGGGYSTTFVIINTGSTNVSARLNFYTQQGVPRPDISQQVDIAIGNSTRLTLPDTGSSITVVWAELIAGSGSVQGVATFDYRINGRLVASAGVLGIEAGNSFLLPVDVTPSGSTGVAVGNATANPLNIALRLIAENGILVATANDPRFIPLGARGQVAAFVDEIFPQLRGTTFKGTLVIDAPSNAPGGALAATALSVKESLLSALPVLPTGMAGANILDFPQVAYGAGYATTFTILNVTSSTVVATLRFYDQQGILRNNLGTSFNIPGNGSARYTLPNTGGTTINVVWGELVTTAGSGVQGVATFDFRTPAGTLTTSAGVLGIQPGNGFFVPVDVTPSGATGIAVSNTKDPNLSLRIRLFGENGAEVNAAVDPRFTSLFGRGQFADFVTNIIPSLAGTTFKGALSIEAAPGTAPGSLAATALTVKEELLSALPVISGVFNGSGGTGGTGGSGGAPTTGNNGPASACFNSLPFTSVINLHLEINITGATAGTAVSDTTTTLNVAFEGQNATEFFTTQTSTLTGLGAITTTARAYSRLDGPDILTFGATGESTIPVATSSKLVYTPPFRDKRYTLAAGESVTQTYSVTTTTMITGLPAPVTQTTSLTDYVRYLGRETVTVPAGTFDTCKFELSGGGLVWTSAGSTPGIGIKSLSGSGANTATTELKLGTINGSPIQP